MARPSEQEPIQSPGLHDGVRFDHPAFGQIGASRVQGSSTLYGSDFIHHHYAAIRVLRSSLERGNSHDWHFGRQEIVEVALSEAQWATFVSSMNVGQGVPCTIQHVQGEAMPSIPLRVQEDAFRSEVQEVAKKAARRVEKAIADVEGVLGESMSKAKRAQVLDTLKSLQMDLASNLPFVSRSFEEHMERTVEKAKVEVNAYVQQTINRAGLAAIAAGEHAPLQLGTGGGE